MYNRSTVHITVYTNSRPLFDSLLSQKYMHMLLVYVHIIPVSGMFYINYAYFKYLCFVRSGLFTRTLISPIVNANSLSGLCMGFITNDGSFF